MWRTLPRVRTSPNNRQHTSTPDDWAGNNEDFGERHASAGTKCERRCPTTGDTGGRTVQALPKETKVTGQMRRQTNYNYTERMFIIYLPYIG